MSLQTADAMFRRRGDGVSECRVCGALVADERTHKSWHRGKR
ncbi:MAG: hypothetical protein ACODAF_06395 [Actinomycetota bacterium]